MWQSHCAMWLSDFAAMAEWLRPCRISRGYTVLSCCCPSLGKRGISCPDTPVMPSRPSGEPRFPRQKKKKSDRAPKSILPVPRQGPVLLHSLGLLRRGLARHFHLNITLIRRWGTWRRAIQRIEGTPLPAWGGTGQGGRGRGATPPSCSQLGLALLWANVSLREVGTATVPSRARTWLRRGYTSDPSSLRIP